MPFRRGRKSDALLTRQRCLPMVEKLTIGDSRCFGCRTCFSPVISGSFRIQFFRSRLARTRNCQKHAKNILPGDIAGRSLPVLGVEGATGSVTNDRFAAIVGEHINTNTNVSPSDIVFATCAADFPPFTRNVPVTADFHSRSKTSRARESPPSRPVDHVPIMSPHSA